MWNSFQGDRESGLFWLLSESKYREKLKENMYRAFWEIIEYFEKVKRDYKESVGGNFILKSTKTRSPE